MRTQCLYCDKNETLHSLMIPICELETSEVYLFKEQTYNGRCIVAYKKHDVELYELNDTDLLAFMRDVNKVAIALEDIFNADKINYGAYSDKLPHLHIHLVPKYVDQADYGGIFVMNPQQTYLTESEYVYIVDKIKNKLLDE
ncbi:MAG: hypothetical protein RL662_511 [Bacteroidota bacterium]